MNDRQDVDHDDLLERAMDAVINDPFPDEPPPETRNAAVQVELDEVRDLTTATVWNLTSLEARCSPVFFV